MSAAQTALVSLRHKFRPGGLGQDTLWAMAAEAAQLMASIVGLAFVVKGVTPNAYSGYVAVFGVIGVAGPPISGGLALAVVHHAVRDREDIVDVARSALSTVLLVGGLLAVIAYMVATHVVEGDISRPAMAMIIVAEMTILPLLAVASATMQAYGQFTWCTQIRVAPLGMRIVGLLTLHFLHAVTLTNVAIVLIYSYLAAAIPALAFLSHVVGRPVVPGRIRLRHLRSGSTYGQGMSALSLQNDGDKVTLDHYRWTADSARYALAYRLIQVGFAPINGLLTASHTRFLGHDDNATDQHVRRSVRFATVSLLYGVAVCAVVWVVAPIVPHLLGAQYAASVTMMRVLSPVVLLRSLGMFPLNGIIGLGKIGVRTVVLMVNAAIAMASYIALVPKYSWKGAVAGSIISETTLAASAWGILVVLQRRHNASVVAADPSVGAHDDLELLGLADPLGSA